MKRKEGWVRLRRIGNEVRIVRSSCPNGPGTIAEITPAVRRRKGRCYEVGVALFFGKKIHEKQIQVIRKGNGIIVMVPFKR